MKPYENILVGMNPVLRAYHRGKWLNREMPPRCAEDLYRERRRRKGAWERREDCYTRCPILGSAKKIFCKKNELFNSLLILLMNHYPTMVILSNLMGAKSQIPITPPAYAGLSVTKKKCHSFTITIYPGTW